MSDSEIYTGTGFSHEIPFSNYASLSREDILDKYDDTSYEKETTGTCVEVIDGDTIWFQANGASNRIKVRFVGVNTPEKTANGYLCSKKFVELLCLNQQISINVDSEKEQDNYGRTLAVVIVEDKNLNEILLHEGLAELMYIPPSEFTPSDWIPQEDNQNEELPSEPTNSIDLKSTIINQKKKLFLYVSQSKNLVWPNSEYDYQIYVKNISGQTIENIRIYVTNPKEIVIPEKKDGEQTYKIPTLKNGQSVLININDCTIMQEGYYHVNFVAMGDETEIKTQSLLIKCGYENDNTHTLHRIAFYNFSPYESAYMERASDFSENVTQLTKIQTKPFEAYNQPFEMDELELDLYAQDMFLTNTDDMPSMYLGRENWESNLKEAFAGDSLMNLIQKINEESELVDIDFLRVGCNEMETDFQRIYPNGFIHRFGLMKSEFYKLLGIIPNIYSINDDLFRWARDETEPEIYPKRENDKWNQKPWCGSGYYVYEHITKENGQVQHIEKAIFSTKQDAEIYVEDLIIFNELHFIENVSYSIKKRDWLPGIFYVEIPINDIPANFLLPNVDEIQAIIELSKPYGLKGYPRFQIQGSFMHTMSFSHIPRFTPHISIQLDPYQSIQYHIMQRRYQYKNGNVELAPYGKQAEREGFLDNHPSFYSYYPKPNICKTISEAKHIRYFTKNTQDENNKHKIEKYILIYSIDYEDFFNNNLNEEDFVVIQDLIGLDIDVLRVSYDELIELLEDNHIKIDYLILNKGLESCVKISQNDFYERHIPLDDEFLVVIHKYDNSISSKITLENIKVQCNNQKSFDGKDIIIGENSVKNALNDVLIKNPEDVSFYIKDTNQFSVNNTQPIDELHIPIKYKTLDYYNPDTSTIIDLESNHQEPSAIKIIKQELPEHVNVNLLISNADKTKDYIISYKKLYDDMYQISYKTYKNTEVVVKEIVTQFDYILCTLLEVSASKTLVKIYYCLDNKIHFITAFTADILKNNGYQVRLSLTNDLVLLSIFSLSTGNILFGDIKYSSIKNNKKYHNWYLENKQYCNLLSTDNYDVSEIQKSNHHWYKLYRINKDETSFASFENTTNEKAAVNDIRLYFNNLNIPDNSIIDKIFVDIYTDTLEEIDVSAAYQLNTNISNENDNQISGIFDISSYNIYTQHNLKYLNNQLRYYQEKENDEQISKYQTLINDNIRQNKDIDIEFSQEQPIIIKNAYWNEVSFKNTETLLSSDVQKIYLIIEGYNHSNNVTLDAQLVYYDGVGDVVSINIDSGYFYKQIPINISSTYNIDELSIRFKFRNIQQIDLYSVKSQIQFSNIQNIINPKYDAGTISINGLNKYSILVCENISGDKVKNGLDILLSFSNIQNYLKIYSAIVNIVYHEKAFTNIFETAPDYNMITSDSNDNLLIRGNIFDEKVSDTRQDHYTMKKQNGEYDAGFEMNHKIYQAFIAKEDNITSIELKLNGRTGAPDNYLKIAILDNYDNLPNNTLKEVIVNVAKHQPINGEAHKFNICVNNLVVGDTYWFSVEPVDKTKQGTRRFLYNNYQINDFKLLSVIDGDVINQHASLYFRMYSKANTYPFNSLPFGFDLKEDLYTKDINLVTEIQIVDGAIRNFKELLFDNNCPYEEEEIEEEIDEGDNDENNPSDVTDNQDDEQQNQIEVILG